MPDIAQRLTAALADRYRFERPLGRGGMATVLLAEDFKHHRQVAIKVLDPEVAAAIGPERFLREIETVAKLTHPHILPLFDSGAADGLLYFVMPYVEGGSLRQRLAREKQLPVEEALAITREVADALGHAHRHGIVHRDIKPENILFEERHALVADFGIARAMASNQADTQAVTLGAGLLTGEGRIVGTPQYMSPEQAVGSRDLDGRSDQYSLGCVLYEMLAGVPPFLGTTAESLVHQHLSVSPRVVTELRPAVPAVVAGALQRALAKSPADRFNPVAQFGEALGISGTGAVAPFATRKARAIAVLPFLDLGGTGDQEYFCDGITEEILNTLTAVGGLKVASRSSSFRFKGAAGDVRRIGGDLNVELILEGSVRSAGNMLRITAQLINVADGYHVWSRKYDRRMEDVFAIQDEIAASIAEALRFEFEGGRTPRIAARHSADIEAYHLYLRGRHCWNSRRQGTLPKGITHFRQAIDRDPTYALAYTGLADSYNVLGFYGYESPSLAFPLATTAAETALRLMPELAEGWVSLGYAQHHFARDWAAAEASYKRAIACNGSYSVAHQWYALQLASNGRHVEAARSIQTARELDPLSPVINTAVGWLGYLAGGGDEGLGELNDTLDLDPGFPWLRYVLGQVHEQASRFKEAADHFREAAEITGRSSFYLAGLGHCLARHGDLDGASRILEEIEAAASSRYVSAMDRAVIFAGLRDMSQLATWLSRALEERAATVVYAGVEPRFAFARSEPGVRELLQRLGPNK